MSEQPRTWDPLRNNSNKPAVREEYHKLQHKRAIHKSLNIPLNIREAQIKANKLFSYIKNNDITMTKRILKNLRMKYLVLNRDNASISENNNYLKKTPAELRHLLYHLRNLININNMKTRYNTTPVMPSLRRIRTSG